MQDTGTQETLLQQGVDLILLGMGTVFVFLTLLVIATTIMSAVIQRYFKASEPEIPGAAAPPAAGAASDPTLLAVIKAAVAQHRGKK